MLRLAAWRWPIETSAAYFMTAHTACLRTIGGQNLMHLVAWMLFIYDLFVYLQSSLHASSRVLAAFPWTDPS